MRAAARVVAAVLLAVVGAGACGDDDSGAAARTLPGEFASLDAGRVGAGTRIRTARFAVPFELEVDRSFYGVDTDAAVVLGTSTTDLVRAPWLTFGAVSLLRALDDPLLSPREVEVDRIDAHLRPVPDDVVAWILGLPALHAEEAGTTEIAGRTARVIDFATDGVPAGRGPCPDDPCVGVNYTVGDEPALGVMLEGVRGRIFVVPVEGDTLLVMAGAQGDRWNEAFVTAVDDTLRSLTLR